MDDARVAKEANKICSVCGDKALGYNFNAVSCESCKAFFRRNALKEKDYLCPFSENCTITPVTRRFCQKCRLDKCFTIGMRKEHIMTEEDKVLKRKKIEQNRSKKRPISSSHTEVTHSKRGNLEDSSCDSTSTSIKLIFSAASLNLEANQKESEGNLKDLIPNNQSLFHNMSPSIAASVPSPSSPPENCHLLGSKTLDMLSTLSDDPFSSSTRNDLYESHNLDNLNSKNISSQLCCNAVSQNQFESQKILMRSLRMTDATKMCKPVEHEHQTNHNHLEYNWKSSKSQNHPTDAVFKEILSEPKASVLNNADPVNFRDKEINMLDFFTGSSESVIGHATPTDQRSEDIIEKDVLVSVLMQNPNWVVEILENPNVVAKFITDQDFMKKLTSDPLTLEIVKKKIASQSQSTAVISSTGMCDSRGNDVSDENLILKDLILNQGTGKERQRKDPITISPQWNETIGITGEFDHNLQRNFVVGNSIDSILCEAIKLEYFTSNLTHDNMDLNDVEKAKLNELIVAHRALSAPLNEDVGYTGSLDKSDPTLLGVINLTAIAVRRLIKMSKKISAFKNMCQEDQLALLKGGCTEMMLLRSALHYDPDKEIWKVPETEHRMASIKVDILKEAKGNLFTEHSKFVSTFDSRWRDENIILILCAIALFSPERPKVIHGDVIKLEQNSYYYLLRRYLESVYPGCEAKSTFLKLIQKMSELHKLNQEVVGVYLNVNPSNIEPLLIEIFDLKR